MNQQMNERDSLHLIESMINKAKDNFNESGTLYLLWGFVILVCSLTQFIAHYFFAYEQAYYVWFLTWLAVIFQFIFLRKRNSKSRVRTYTEDIIGAIWFCFFICMMAMVFVLIRQGSYTSIQPAILVLYGIPTFLAGTILRFNTLKYGGICCWPLAIGCTFAPQEFQLLFISAAVIAAWIIPGIYLRKRYMKKAALQPGL
jgi:uncharacterized membrane protein